MAKKTEEKLPESQATEAAAERADSASSENAAETLNADADKGDEESPAPETEDQQGTVKMTLRHKSHTQFYHRAGIAITKFFADYDVPAGSVEKIKADKWIEVKEAK